MYWLGSGYRLHHTRKYAELYSPTQYQNQLQERSWGESWLITPFLAHNQDYDFMVLLLGIHKGGSNDEFIPSTQGENSAKKKKKSQGTERQYLCTVQDLAELLSGPRIDVEYMQFIVLPKLRAFSVCTLLEVWLIYKLHLFCVYIFVFFCTHLYFGSIGSS